jgi:hypothetical protein
MSIKMNKILEIAGAAISKKIGNKKPPEKQPAPSQPLPVGGFGGAK